jgi:hypothetical protein
VTHGNLPTHDGGDGKDEEADRECTSNVHEGIEGEARVGLGAASDADGREGGADDPDDQRDNSGHHRDRRGSEGAGGDAAARGEAKGVERHLISRAKPQLATQGLTAGKSTDEQRGESEEEKADAQHAERVVDARRELG